MQGILGVGCHNPIPPAAGCRQLVRNLLYIIAWDYNFMANETAIRFGGDCNECVQEELPYIHIRIRELTGHSATSENAICSLGTAGTL